MEPEVERRALGQVIRALRELEGLSRDELGDRAELGVDMIAKVEQGAKAPSASALKRLARALGLDPIELSNRVLVWAAMKDSPEASTALLRTVATAGMAAFPSLNRARVASPAAAAAVVAGAAGFAYGMGHKSKREIEEALRTRLKRLEERLDQASPEELERLAVALEDAMPDESTAE